MRERRRRARAHAAAAAWAALATVLAPGLAPSLAPGLAAQVQGGPLRGPAGPGWRPSVGARLGLDDRNQAPSIGALLRLPIPIPGVRLAAVPGGDLVFHDGLTERQGMVDLTVDVFGITVGGGPVALSSVFGEDEPNQTKVGYTILAGLQRSTGRLGTNLEFRWIWVEELRPRFIMLGITYTPGAPPRRGRF